MSVYDLRSLFPYNGFEFPAGQQSWICRLAEVSDLRPDSDQFSWYLVFEPGENWTGARPGPRKLEIVTSAKHLLEAGFPPEAEERLANWISGSEQDGRLEWREF
jgi:hypothetical protein